MNSERTLLERLESWATLNGFSVAHGETGEAIVYSSDRCFLLKYVKLPKSQEFQVTEFQNHLGRKKLKSFENMLRYMEAAIG